MPTALIPLAQIPTVRARRPRRVGAARGAFLCALTVLTLLAGCTAYTPRALGPGSTIDEARQTLGRPTGEYRLPRGETRVEFARGPYGLHTYMLDYDAAGRLLRWEQVLTEARFNTILPGMPAEQVLLTLGHSFEHREVGVAEKRQTVWAYRFDNPFCQWFQVGIDKAGRVMDTAYGPDPRCEVERDFSL